MQLFRLFRRVNSHCGTSHSGKILTLVNDPGSHGGCIWFLKCIRTKLHRIETFHWRDEDIPNQVNKYVAVRVHMSLNERNKLRMW